ncbi:MAG: hypothetical protein IJ326_05185 [Lachnospiraceae bacterium]|nr:hypothetical protein [Lachnospiraceae bacterium]
MNKRFVDMHCHILPGVDDGAMDVAQSQKMLRMAAKEGICEIVTTPHYKASKSRKNVSSTKVKQLVEELQQWLDNENIPIHLYTGNEILYNYEIDNLLEAHNVCSLADSFYVLIEFSPKDEYTYIKNGVQKVLMAGYVPLIAHIERYDALRKRTERIEELIEMGAYMQVNAGSITGRGGWMTKRCVLRWIKQELIHVVATDAHDDVDRVPALAKAAQIVEKKYGSGTAKQLFCMNPRRIIEGKLL